MWRGPELARQPAVVPSGLAALDAVLPGGGWPRGALVEVLQQSPGRHVWQLLLPALGRIMQDEAGPVVLVAPPWHPFGPGLAAQGLRTERLLCLQAEPRAARLWATEQALRCAQVAAVLAWLPQVRNEELRRLHLAAQQQERLLFVFRDAKDRRQASPATLRLLLEGIDSIELSVLKRRGPPLVRPVQLPATSRRLAALLAARHSLRAPSRPPLSAAPLEESHGLDRTAAIP